jgi:hypothetical protein
VVKLVLGLQFYAGGSQSALHFTSILSASSLKPANQFIP